MNLLCFSERQDTETSPSGETEDKWEEGLGGRRVAQPETTLVLRRVLPHPEHCQQQHSRLLDRVVVSHLRNQEEDEKGEDSQDSNASSAGSMTSRITAAIAEPAGAAAPPKTLGSLGRLQTIQRAHQAAALVEATSYL